MLQFNPCHPTSRAPDNAYTYEYFKYNRQDDTCTRPQGQALCTNRGCLKALWCILDYYGGNCRGNVLQPGDSGAKPKDRQNWLVSIK